MAMQHLKIDLGCGFCKKEGTVGVDILAQPGVDYVLNLQTEPLPFPDQSVDYVYSSHCLEHISDPTRVFAEISRVCTDGAKLEFWTPYAWENSAFIIDHKLFFNEDHYLHMCVWFVDFWEKILKARWLLKEFTYIVEPDVLVELYKNQISLDFAVRYYKGVVKEFCANIEVKREYKGETIQPIKTFAVSRSAERYLIKSESDENPKSNDLKEAINWFSA
uniref:class I SAM-dependent methyltransferase n=1 Tax=Trichocoleus desertorum TaxID=1481672 RepID=UPI0025B4C270|nr:class I SAM-dependent methyltransferase [Trichocoleus desertorum]